MRCLNETSELIIIYDLEEKYFLIAFFRYGKVVAQHTFNCQGSTALPLKIRRRGRPETSAKKLPICAA